jgi:hypothetical protein
MRLDELSGDLNSIAAANANHFVANTRLRTSYFDGWPTLGFGFLTKNLLGPTGDWLGAVGCSFLSLGMAEFRVLFLC